PVSFLVRASISRSCSRQAKRLDRCAHKGVRREGLGRLGPGQERVLLERVTMAKGDHHAMTEAQQQRLDALMARWRTLRDQGAPLPADEQAELEVLIAEELQASAARATALADALGR